MIASVQTKKSLPHNALKDGKGTCPQYKLWCFPCFLTAAPHLMFKALSLHLGVRIDFSTTLIHNHSPLCPKRKCYFPVSCL